MNFKDLLDALATLYYAEMFLIKKICELNGGIDVPDKYSKLFKIENWVTKNQTVQVGERVATNKEIDDLFKENELIKNL